MKLIVYKSGDEKILTSKGLYRIESYYHVDDILVNDKTGDYHFIKEMYRDESGSLKEIITE